MTEVDERCPEFNDSPGFIEVVNAAIEADAEKPAQQRDAALAVAQEVVRRSNDAHKAYDTARDNGLVLMKQLQESRTEHDATTEPDYLASIAEPNSNHQKRADGYTRRGALIKFLQDTREYLYERHLPKLLLAMMETDFILADAHAELACWNAVGLGVERVKASQALADMDGGIVPFAPAGKTFDAFTAAMKAKGIAARAHAGWQAQVRKEAERQTR